MPFVTDEFVKQAEALAKQVKEDEAAVKTAAAAVVTTKTAQDEAVVQAQERVKSAAALVADTLVACGRLDETQKSNVVETLQSHESTLQAMNKLAAELLNPEHTSDKSKPKRLGKAASVASNAPSMKDSDRAYLEGLGLIS